MAKMPVCDEKEVAVKVEGDLGNIVIDDVADDDYDGTTVSDCGMLTAIPRDLLKPSPPPAYSSVMISNSENVQFGNNTFFNGPVTIKQIIANGEHDNKGYEHTEDDTMPPGSQRNGSPDSDDTKCVWDLEPFEFRWWIKMGIILFSVLVFGGICAIIMVIGYNATQDNNDKITLFKDNDINCNLVEGVCLNMNVIKIFTLLLTCATLCGVWYMLYLLTIKYILTRNCCHGHDEVTKYVPVTKKQPFIHQFKPAKDDSLLIAADHLRIVTRTNWLAGPVQKPLDKLHLPAPWVIITHTDTESCNIQSECVLRVRLIQMFHVESREWFDIGYNFLVGGDGSAYYGRGWDYQGAHTLGYNRYSVGIAFIGNFNNQAPPKHQIEACQKLIKRGVELGKIAKDYKLFGHRQLSSTLSPGDKLYEIIKEWPHFVKNDTDIDELVPKN